MTIVTMSVVELAVIRQNILNSFLDTDDEATDLKNMERLYEIEQRIEESPFQDDADKRAGNLILMENEPSGWDNFQESLFLRMQEFA
jgi:hypothetical protein